MQQHNPSNVSTCVCQVLLYIWLQFLFDSWRVFARTLISPWPSDHQSSWWTLFQVMVCHLLPNPLLRYCQLHLPWYLRMHFFIVLAHLSHETWWYTHRLGHHWTGLSVEPTKMSLTFVANYETNSFQGFHMKGPWENRSISRESV